MKSKCPKYETHVFAVKEDDIKKYYCIHCGKEKKRRLKK